MISNNNTLHDLAELVIDSTILYKDESGNYITNGRDLIRKMENSPQSQKRNSDPTVRLPFLTIRGHGPLC
jgi:hypothetical protein